MRTAAYKVGVASDRRRRKNVPRHILFYYPIPPSAIPRISTIKQIGT